MAEIVEPPKKKRVPCRACEAVIAYLPEEVDEVRPTGEDATYTDRVKCPRPGCPGWGIIKSW